MQPEQPQQFQQPIQPVLQPPVTSVGAELPEAQPIQWQAPEYVQERRSPWWFIGFWAVVVILMVIAALLLRSWSFALLIPVMAGALMIYSHRPPRILSYVLSGKGIYINEKLHPMAEFKSFGVSSEESMPSLMLIPVKRFRPALAVHFPPEVGEALVDTLGRRIPMQEITPDLFDRVIRKLHI